LEAGQPLYGASAEQLAICQDLNDYWALGDAHVGDLSQRLTPTGGENNWQHVGREAMGHIGLKMCGYGTHSSKCGERVVYAHEDAPGGCEQTCNDALMESYIEETFKLANDWNPKTFCSDGGEGSKRVLFSMPSQKDPRRYHQHIQELDSHKRYFFWDFACSYGTQVRDRRKVEPSRWHIPLNNTRAF